MSRVAHAALPVSCTMRPSENSTTRAANAATLGSWVTITSVTPCSLKSRNSSRISRVVLESSAPVGSSANSSRGSFTMARAIATLLLPTGQLIRTMRGPVSQAHLLQSPVGPFATLAG